MIFSIPGQLANRLLAIRVVPDSKVILFKLSQSLNTPSLEL